MFLNEIAQKNMKEKFDSFIEEDDDFEKNSFEGRIDLTDRFLSIYNRPTRKRQLYIRPDTKLPDSYVFRHPTTNDIYIIGQVRQDARYDITDGDPYVSISMLHLVTPSDKGSCGRAVHTRRVTTGPQEDPGWAEAVELGRPFMDVEFRTSSAEEGVYDTKVENYYAWCPITMNAKQWDGLELNGVRYRVVDVFTDIGMRGLRLDQEGDPRINVVLHTSTRTYNNVTHDFEVVSRAYNITVIVPSETDISHWMDTRERSLLTLVVDQENIGLTPKPDMQIEYQGRKRLVRSVTTQAGEKQYRLECE